MSVRALCLGVFLLAAGGIAICHAAAETGGQTALQHAAEQRRHGEIEAALKTLEDALKTTSDDEERGQIYFQIGLIYGTDEPSRAKAAFRNALVHNPSLMIDGVRHKPALVHLFREVHGGLSGRILVRGDESIVSVLHVDSKDVGMLPHDGVYPIGNHLLEAFGSTGELLFRRAVIVRADHTEEIVVSAPESAAGLGTAQSTPGFWERPRLWTWVTLGGAVAATGVAIGFGLAAQSNLDRANERKEALNNDPLATRSDPEISDAVDALDSQQLIANVAWGIAGAFAISSVLLLIFEGTDEAPEKSGPLEAWTPVTVAPTLGRAPGGQITWFF